MYYPDAVKDFEEGCVHCRTGLKDESEAGAH